MMFTTDLTMMGFAATDAAAADGSARTRVECPQCLEPITFAAARELFQTELGARAVEECGCFLSEEEEADMLAQAMRQLRSEDSDW